MNKEKLNCNHKIILITLYFMMLFIIRTMLILQILQYFSLISCFQQNLLCFTILLYGDLKFKESKIEGVSRIEISCQNKIMLTISLREIQKKHSFDEASDFDSRDADPQKCVTISSKDVGENKRYRPRRTRFYMHHVQNFLNLEDHKV